MIHLFAVVLMLVVARYSDAARVMAEWPLAHPDKVNLKKSFILNDCAVAGFRADDLTLTTTGPDAYVVGPADQPFAAHSGRQLRVKLTVSSGTSGAIYFATTESAAFSERRRISFSINADNCPHEYTIDPSSNPKWTGTIARLRLDIDGTTPGSTVRIHSFRVEQPSPKLDISSFHTDTGLIRPGQNVQVTARIVNTGGVDLTDLDISLYVPPEVDVIKGDVHTTGKTLSIDDSITCVWTVRPPQGGLHVLTVSVLGQPDVSASEQLTMAPCGTMPATAPPFETMRAEWTRDGAVVLTNRRLCLYVARDGGKYGPIGLYYRNADGRTSDLAAVMPRFAQVELDDGTCIDVFPTVSRLNRGRYEGKPFVQASFTAVFDFGTVDIFLSVNETDPWVAATYTLTATRDMSVTRFAGSTLLAGEGGFGRSKRCAIFPGIEDLVAGERSSDDTDALTGYERSVPDPDKITIPYMAVRYDDKIVQLMWPPRGTAGTGWSPLTAVFSSPNRIDDQNNHLMELFAPGGRSFVHENQRQAFVPVSLAAGKQLVINAKLAVYRAARKGIADAVRVWCEAYGVPPVLPPPRLTEDALALCAKAYIDTCWDDKTCGWRPHLTQNGPKPRFMPDAVVSLIMAGLMGTDDKIAEQCRARVRQATDNRPNSSFSPALAWRLGGIRGSIESLKLSAQNAAAKQQPNGSWTYPGDDHDPPLGSKGQTAPGVCADQLIKLLNYAGVTGDSKTEAAAVRGLEFAKRFTVPRGDQLWEIPIHTPDIRAAGRMGMAFLLGYKLTGDTTYLDEARYWADTGLPFVYFWHDPARPVLSFASIPVLGATLYRSPNWIGRPVQWCGLDYARLPAELDIVKFDKLYEHAARGILNSALHQQIDAGPLLGTYPDSWLLDTNRSAGPYIAPGLIVTLASIIQGYATDLQWSVYRDTASVYHISSAARILDVSARDRELNIDLKYPVSGTCFTAVTGFGHPPVGVLWNDTVLTRTDEPEQGPGTWSYSPDDDILIVNSRFEKDTVRMQIGY